MNLRIPGNFVSVSQAQFEDALASVDYRRTGWINGEAYTPRGSDVYVAMRIFDGSDPTFHIDSGYFR